MKFKEKIIVLNPTQAKDPSFINYFKSAGIRIVKSKKVKPNIPIDKATERNKKFLIKHGYSKEQVDRMDIIQLVELCLEIDRDEDYKIREDLLAQKEDRKECKCSCHQLNSVAFACTECQKNHPTPSPLEEDCPICHKPISECNRIAKNKQLLEGFEEIEELDWNEDKTYSPKELIYQLGAKINEVISNQKKLYQYIKSLKEKL